MRNIKESVAINASPEQLWGLLVDPATIAAHCPGVTSYELLPEDEPMRLGSQMRVGVIGASDLVLAQVVQFDHPGYSIRSQVVEGPHDLHGELGARLDPISDTRSQLIIDGELDCGWLGKPGLVAFLLGFKVGLPLLGQQIAHLAKQQSS